jgi:hypothetical protein
MRTFLILVASFLAPVVYADCYIIFGKIQTKPDPEACNTIEKVFRLSGGEVYTGECFQIRGKGTAIFKGVSGLTGSPVVSALSGGETSTPLALVQSERAGLLYFTSNAYLEGRIATRHGIKEGSIRTVDTGTIDVADGVVAQILRIKYGTEDLEGASGRILVYGPEVFPGWASYRGNLCISN